MDLNSVNWYYRGEGNTNLVIALPDLGQVLRISKTDNPNSMRTLIEFQKLISQQLSVYIRESTTINLDKKVIAIISHVIQSHRPPNRLHKSLQAGDALLIPDFTILPNSNPLYPTFCVELKLKQAWNLPNEQQSKLCVFCLHQYLKLTSHNTKSISKYCPLDLFSGNVTRMRGAIIALIETPQNNFQIFKDGHIVYGDGGSLETIYNVVSEIFGNDRRTNLNKFQTLLCTILLNDFSQKNVIRNQIFYENKHQHLPKNNCEYLNVPTLPDGCVLQILWKLQQFNKIDIKSVHSVYTDFISLNKNCENWNILDLITNDRSAPSVNKMLSDYLLFSTFRDCSVMMSFQKKSSNNNYDEFNANVTIADLDPKPLKCIQKHYCDRQKALDAFTKYHEKI